jgi:hypothetical protein
MSDPIGRLIPGLDPVSGAFALPLWAAAALAALFAVFCILAFNRAGREGMVGGLARTALVLVGATATLFIMDGWAHQNRSAERLVLDARAAELAGRATMPGSVLACLDAVAGEAVERHCEKSLFATPQGMASAVSYVAARLALLADVSDFVSRGHPAYEPMAAKLRRVLESDRFGLVAHVLATQEGCTPDQCAAFALMRDTTRVSGHLAARTYDAYVQRHATVWPAMAPAPVANLAPSLTPPLTLGAVPLPANTSAYVAPRPAGPNVFFPSSDSIPPVSIMTTEPVDTETTGSSAASAPPAKRAPSPPRRPAQSAPSVAPAPAPPPQSQSAAPPMDLNAAARTGTPPAATTQ